MSQKIKLKHLNDKFQNHFLNLPIDGIVKIEQGFVEVSPAAAEVLLRDPEHWELAEKPNKQQNQGKGTKEEKAKKSGRKKAVVEETEEEEEEVEQEEAEDGFDIAELDNMDLEALQEVAEQAGISGWKKLKNNEVALRAYLRSRLK